MFPLQTVNYFFFCGKTLGFHHLSQHFYKSRFFLVTVLIVFQTIRSSFQGDHLLVGWIFSRCILAHFQWSLQDELFQLIYGIKFINQTVSCITNGKKKTPWFNLPFLLLGQNWWSVCGFKINKLILATPHKACLQCASCSSTGSRLWRKQQVLENSVSTCDFWKS